MPPRWSRVLRALREARGLTQDGWALCLGVSRATVQRWEAGERAPDPGAETAILTYCRESGLYDTFLRRPLAGVTLTAEALQELLTEARLDNGSSVGVEPGSVPEIVSSEKVASQPRFSALSSRSSNLPAPLTTFVGREQEIAAVRRALGGARLLTLTGMGGCGKTRLALEVANELLWAFPHGICLVELAALADPALVPQALASALGVHTTGHPSTTEALLDFLNARHTLLILDNCEHLVGTCADLVETLLRACPNLEVLATSREPLGVAGETIWRVPPLSLPGGMAAEDSDAVRLFVERARLYQADFALTAANEPEVVEICRRLDGIPLAIELAAARIPVLAPAQIVERLNDRFRLLTGGSRTALPRHQTLRATLDWSHDLLTASEQAMLRRLSVFAGGFTLEAAEAVTALSEDRPDALLDPLSSLVSKSMVMAQGRYGAVRYRMLETARQYAAERLVEAGETAVVADRFVAWCLALAKGAEAEFSGPRQQHWLMRLEVEHDNLRAALRWCEQSGRDTAGLELAATLGPFWEGRDYLLEGRDRLARALARAPDGPAVLRARALCWAGALAWRQADHAAARRDLDEALKIARGVGDARTVSYVLGYLGMLDHVRGDYATAKLHFTNSLAIARELNEPDLIANALSRLGILARAVSDFAKARIYLEESLALRRAIGDVRGISKALDNLGLVARDLGEYDAARVFHEESLTIARELDMKWGIAAAQGNLALVYQSQGEHAMALPHWQAVLAVFREIGDRRGVANTLINLGVIARAQEDYAAANAYHQESLELYRAQGDQRGVAYALVSLAVTALRQGDLAVAETLHREGLVVRSALGDKQAVAESLMLIARLTHARGQAPRAARLFGAAEALREAVGAPLLPRQRPDYERDVAATRAALGDQAFAAVWAEGRAMSVEAAVAYALAAA